MPTPKHLCILLILIGYCVQPVRGNDPALSLPIVLKPFKHEASQFGYDPRYVTNVPSFDSRNRPYIRSRTADRDRTGFIHTLRDGRWVKRKFTQAVRDAYPEFEGFIKGGGWTGSRVVFDAEDHLYTPLAIRLKDGSSKNILLYSRDYGKSFSVHELPDGELNMEYRTGHNALTRPPLISVMRVRAEHPHGRWTDYYNLRVIQPRKRDGRLEMGEPVLITGDALHMTRHSGNASFAASGPEKTFITWAECTPTNDAPGTPTYVATFDPEENRVYGKQLVGYAAPPNDGHNTPGICLDARGYLHVATGAHGANFLYSHSLKPRTTEGGWSEPVPMLEGGWRTEEGGRGRQSYLAMVCGPEGALHSVFRQWRRGVDPYFNGDYYGALAYQRKPAGEDWDEKATPLVIPPTDGYSIYYHKLAIDRAGRLFLSYSYRSDAGLYYESKDGLYHYMAVLISDDGGETWDLAATKDFTAAVESP